MTLFHMKSFLIFSININSFYLLTSLFEGNPKVLLEAMALGISFLAFEVRGIKECRLAQQNGILLKPDLSDLHSNLKMIIGDKQLQSLMVSKNAVEYKKFVVFSVSEARTNFINLSTMTTKAETTGGISVVLCTYNNAGVSSLY